MTPNISAIEIDIKINNYVALHPELRGKEKAYIISIMLKNFALTTEEAKKLQESSIYSNPFSQANGEYISPLANDNFIASNTDENTNTEEKNNIISTIANIKVDSDGKVDRRQFTVKELLKKYEPPEYKIERNINNQQEEIIITNSKNNIVFFLLEFDNEYYRVIQNDKNTKYETAISNGYIQNSEIKKEKADGSYTITKYYGTIKNSEIQYGSDDCEKNKTNYVVTDLIKSLSDNNKTALKNNILNKISKLNIEENLIDYQKETKRDLITDIATNKNLDENEKSLLIEHLISNYKNQEELRYVYKSYLFNEVDKDINNSDKQSLLTHLKFVKNANASALIKELEQSNELNEDQKLKIYTLFSEYNPNYVNNNSRIQNKYYKGYAYKVKQNEDYSIDIYSWATGKTNKIDLKKLCKNIPLKYQPQFFSEIQKLPAEVLEDINAEASLVLEEFGNNNDDRSSYTDDDDTMNVTMYQITQDTIIHELGHAIDNIRLNTNSKDTNIEQESRWITNDPDILKIYNQEKENYISAGNQAYNEEDVLDKETKTWNTTVTEGPYCTWNIKEFFAESYGLMMLESPSDHNSIECIEKYFPKTFAAVKAKLKQVRKMSAEERHYC